MASAAGTWPQMWPCLYVLSGFGWIHRHKADAVISQKRDELWESRLPLARLLSCPGRETYFLGSGKGPRTLPMRTALLSAPWAQGCVACLLLESPGRLAALMHGLG